MVQSLKEIIDDENYDETSVKEVFSNFTSSKNADVEDFIKDKAIDFEKKNLSRTFLVLDDDALQNDKIKLLGFFTLGIKSIIFGEDATLTKRNEIAKSKIEKSIACFLLGQIARDDKNSKKGFGKIIFDEAIRKIKMAQQNVAGRCIYLDCKKEMKDYYINLGFKLLQNNPEDQSLFQMYTKI